MHPLATIAPEFIRLAHSIVWATAATVTRAGAPRTRILHPIWEWDGERLTGWVATSPLSPKADDLDHRAEISFTYWRPNHDTCGADCLISWEDEEGERAGWERLARADPPVGYDPSIIPAWTSPDVEAFGVLRLEPYRLRTMPGTVMISGEGELMTWRS